MIVALPSLPEAFSSTNLIASANKYMPKWLPPGSLSTVCGLVGLVSAVAAITLTLVQINDRGYGREGKIFFFTTISIATLLPSTFALLVAPKVGDLACILGLVGLAVVVTGVYVAHIADNGRF